MSNKWHKCRFRLSLCPFQSKVSCKDCMEVNYNPNAKFTEDDLVVHNVKHLFQIGDTIPDNITGSKIL
jgi:hypothetical protein